MTWAWAWAWPHGLLQIGMETAVTRVIQVPVTGYCMEIGDGQPFFRLWTLGSEMEMV